MMSTQPAGPTFREGDEVVLAKGSYQGTLGIFLHMKEDTNWRTSGNATALSSHPVIWLARAKPIPASAN